jgi:hypothetical protein
MLSMTCDRLGVSTTRLQFYIAYIKNVEFNFSARAASLDYNHEKEYICLCIKQANQSLSLIQNWRYGLVL